MKKKLILAAVTAMSLMTLAACSGNSNEDIATMKGGAVTVEDFFNEAKNDSNSQNIIRQMIVFKVFDKAYGDKVTEKMIDAEYDKTAAQYGDTFEKQLEAAGLTKKSYREQIKQSLALKEGLKANMKITDADLKAAWETFHPEVEAQLIEVASEDEAKEIEQQLKDGGDFTKIAKEKSTDAATKEDGGEVKFDSTSTTIPAEVQTAAFALKDGEVSEPIAATNTSYVTNYYIVKMVKNQDKGNDMDKYKKQLTEIAENTKLNDATFVTETIGKELKAANVKIKDKSFSNILSDYISAADKSTSSSDTKATDSSDAKATDSSEATATSSSAATEATSSTESAK